MIRKLVFLLLVLTAGCATVSQPTRYYTVDMTCSGETVCPRSVVVERLRVVDPLTRRNIMVKTSSTQIEYYARAEWAAPVDDLVAQKLQTELGESGSTENAYALTGTVLVFEQVDHPQSPEAYAKVRVVVREREKRPLVTVLEKTYEARMPMASATPADAAVALSRALEQIAQAIASDLSQVQ